MKWSSVWTKRDVGAGQLGLGGLLIIKHEHDVEMQKEEQVMGEMKLKVKGRIIWSVV